MGLLRTVLAGIRDGRRGLGVFLLPLRSQLILFQSLTSVMINSIRAQQFSAHLQGTHIPQNPAWGM